MALLRNVGGVHVSRRMARLDVWRAVTLFLQLASRDSLHLPGDYPRHLGVFIDGANVDAYVPHGCVSIRLTLPTTRRPHQLDSILRVGQYIDKENPNQLRMPIDRLGLIEVLIEARDGHLDGHHYCLVHYPDWGCLGSVLAAEAPGHQNACIACPVSRDDWKQYGFDTQAERSLGYYDTPLRSFLDLFESPLDVWYDVWVMGNVGNMGLGMGRGQRMGLQQGMPPGRGMGMGMSMVPGIGIGMEMDPGMGPGMGNMGEWVQEWVLEWGTDGADVMGSSC